MNKYHQNGNLYMDLHILQTVPPSCINRDDTGSPKNALYGGVTRARVSSQAWKRAMRQMFFELLEPEEIGQRTKGIVGMVAEHVANFDAEADAEALAISALEKAGLAIKSAKKGTDALFFISSAQARALAALIVAKEEDKELYRQALKNFPSVDMALFGRMVASDPSLNYDAAAQVAHCISTHAIQNEYDYFTAVDDRADEESAGAGHLGTTEFNSSTLYRYATVNVMELYKHLDLNTGASLRAFAEAFIRSMPTGKQNAFANRTLPDMIYVTFRMDQPVSMVGAFEKPVFAGNEGYMSASKKAFAAYAEETYQNFLSAPAAAFATSRGTELKALANAVPMQELLHSIETFVTEYFADSEVE